MKNVDADEIAKFSALASEWWDPKGPMKPLHALNPLRLAFIEKHANIKNKHILDMGCGGGILTESLALAGAHATGIDMSEPAIHIAKQHAIQSNLTIHYEKTRCEDFANANPEKYDVISCMEMLEHVPDPAAIVCAASQLIKPNGLIFFSTLNRNLTSFLSAIIGAEYLLQLLPKGTHHYDKFIRPSELTQCAEKNNLVLRGLQGITYHPFKNKFELTDSVDVNYLIIFQKNQTIHFS